MYNSRRRPIPLAIDTSAVLAVLLNETSRPALVAAVRGASLVGAPSLPWEVGSALVAAVRRQRLTPAEARTAWASYARIPVRLAEIDVAQALVLAASQHLRAYDAYVLQAARTEGASLLTLDGALARAARTIGLAVLELPA